MTVHDIIDLLDSDDEEVGGDKTEECRHPSNDKISVSLDRNRKDPPPQPDRTHSTDDDADAVDNDGLERGDDGDDNDAKMPAQTLKIPQRQGHQKPKLSNVDDEEKQLHGQDDNTSLNKRQREDLSSQDRGPSSSSNDNDDNINNEEKDSHYHDENTSPSKRQRTDRSPHGRIPSSSSSSSSASSSAHNNHVLPASAKTNMRGKLTIPRKKGVNKVTMANGKKFSSAPIIEDDIIVDLSSSSARTSNSCRTAWKGVEKVGNDVATAAAASSSSLTLSQPLPVSQGRDDPSLGTNHSERLGASTTSTSNKAPGPSLSAALLDRLQARERRHAVDRRMKLKPLPPPKAQSSPSKEEEERGNGKIGNETVGPRRIENEEVPAGTEGRIQHNIKEAVVVAKPSGELSACDEAIGPSASPKTGESPHHGVSDNSTLKTPEKPRVGVIDEGDTEEERSRDDLNQRVAGQVDTQYIHPIFGRQLIYFDMLCPSTSATCPLQKLGWKVNYLNNADEGAGTVPEYAWNLTYHDIGMVPDFVWSFPPRFPNSTDWQHYRIYSRMASFIKWCTKMNPHFTILLQRREETLAAVTPFMKQLSEELNLHTVFINTRRGNDCKGSTQLWSNDYNLIERLGDSFRPSGRSNESEEHDDTDSLSSSTDRNSTNQTLIGQYVARYIDSKFCMNRIRERTNYPKVSEREEDEFNKMMAED